MTITFDRALTPAVLNVANWFVRFNNQVHIVTAAAAPGGPTVVLTLDAPGPNPGANTVEYTPPPFDVLADCGTPAVAFFIGLV